MGKLRSFVFGSLLGAGGMYVGLQYHVLQAPEGFLLVSRAPQHRLQDAYADVRNWDAKTWSARPQLALAVTRQGRGDLITDGVTEGAKAGLIDRLRESFTTRESAKPETSVGWEPATTTATPPVQTPIVRDPEQEQSRSEASAPARRGFLPLAELFGIGGKAQADTAAAPEPEHSEQASAPVLPAATSRPREVELLPPPKEFLMLDSPEDVDLGTPGVFPKSDRRRTDASDGWEPFPAQLN